MNDTHSTITVLILLLLIASGVAMASKWVPVPYTLALVIVGLAVSPMHFLSAIHISPDLILLIFLPALLFEAAWNLKLERLKANLVPILSLAVVGVILSVGMIAVILHVGTGIPWSSALLFGSIVSATDPVSVLALFKKLGAPKQLTVILEGESLFNDGTAVVVFRIILGAVIGLTGPSSTGAIVTSALVQFVIVIFGGVILGGVIGFVASKLTSYFDDHLLEIMLTTIAAYGSFILAERVHVSPVIAVLLTGFFIGNYGRKQGMSPNTEVAVDSFWEYAAFVVNSLVFLLIGIEIQLSFLAEYSIFILWAILSMTISRAITTYGFFPITNKFTKPIPFRMQHIVFWGGLRGSLSIALVLSLPLNLPGRVQLVAMTLGAVTFSLLVQGLTISPLMRLLKIKRETADDTDISADAIPLGTEV